MASFPLPLWDRTRDDRVAFARASMESSRTSKLMLKSEKYREALLQRQLTVSDQATIARTRSLPNLLGSREVVLPKSLVQKLNRSRPTLGTIISPTQDGVNASSHRAPPPTKTALEDFLAARDPAASLNEPARSKPPALPSRERPAERQHQHAIIQATSDAMNSRFTELYKAFQFIDIDRSGYLGGAELRRALDLWNLKVDDATISALMKACDTDGDGQVSYAEFVDALARDTVSLGAMAKQRSKAAHVDQKKANPHWFDLSVTVDLPKLGQAGKASAPGPPEWWHFDTDSDSKPNQRSSDFVGSAVKVMNSPPFSTLRVSEELTSTHKASYLPIRPGRYVAMPVRPKVQPTWAHTLQGGHQDLSTCKVDTQSTMKESYPEQRGQRLMLRTESCKPTNEYRPEAWAADTLASTMSKTFPHHHGDYRAKPIKPEGTLTMDYFM